ncbi:MULTISPECIES: FadR/GntR family transcriptional regulator [Streptomyces]|uniref:FadR family transcriptional regulator n=2 Tax=Streptomyces rimosus subsp. rimosus TaxID=132474 RepID=A0A8A1UWI3_STRR1|nr:MULTISPECIES: FadR/GntR family transcriptional regulator [Streptomyces]KOG71567.1 GntR family transcriptional regulator [Kitasatospora aureofaciens]MYT47127.1 FCD domain-containing protein [Streptomyces sp. SID5471]KEF08140.1 GntR family transcriptional regulator [Streptomyces rimosus]KOT29940.1 GntR family transcriptional regulator [Streptomyces rimosus subsp. rimosus]KOT47380.1 GntR family transcriptional regulator [Streptomyces sp. NRRL WC-3701]
MALQAAGRQSLVDTVVEALRAQLAAGTWPVGERIPTEHALAEQLQVGRNTVREAVRVLVHAGMLRSRQGEGTFVVSQADPGDIMRGVQRAGIRDVLELRIALEAEAARLAAQRHRPDDLDRMRAALDAQAALEAANGQPFGGDLELYADHDVAFHRAVVEAAHNTALTATYAWFSSSVREALLTSLDDEQMPRMVHGDHRAVLDAIASGDPEAAEKAVRALLEPPKRALEKLLAER